jgi:hypothetical protein
MVILAIVDGNSDEFHAAPTRSPLQAYEMGSLVKTGQLQQPV